MVMNGALSILPFEISVCRLFPEEKLAAGDRRWRRFNEKEADSRAVNKGTFIARVHDNT
jgi:hypothetical protein